METISEIWRFTTAISGADKTKLVRGLLRIAFAMLVLWPVGAFYMALNGGHTYAFSHMLSWAMVLVVPIVILAYQYPFLSLFAVKIGYTRNLLHDLLMVMGMELTVGIFCSWVPLAESPDLAKQLVLIALALFLIGVGKQVSQGKKVKLLLMLLFLGATVSFFPVKDWLSSKQGDGDPGNTQTQQARPEVIENGILIPNPQTNIIPPTSLKKETSVVRIGSEFIVTTNCDEEANLGKIIGPIPPGKKIIIRHITLENDEENRCSVVNWKKGIYWFGPQGMESAKGDIGYRPRYVNDVPFPTLPPHAFVFSLIEESSGETIKSGYAGHLGDKFVLENTSEKSIILSDKYNYAQFFKKEHEKDIGYDGSTLTFGIRIE